MVTDLNDQDDGGGSGGEWTQDGTFGNSGTSSVNYSLSSQYDQVRVWITSDSSATTGTALDLQVNGTTSGYSTRQLGGGSSSDSFVKHALTAGFSHGGVLLMDGTWGGAWNVHCVKGSDPMATSPAPAIEGVHSGLSGSALTQFTVLDDAVTAFTIQGYVEGRNL